MKTKLKQLHQSGATDGQVVKWNNGSGKWEPGAAGGVSDSDAIHDNVGSEISAITEKTTPVSGDLLLIEDSAASNAKKKVQIGNLPGAVFGSEYQKAESLGESTTTSSTYQQKLRFTTSSVPAGDYYIGWSLTLGSSSTKKTSDFRVQVDDTTTLTEAGPDSSVTGWQVSQSGFGIVTLTAATHDIDIDFKSSDGVTTAEIKDVRVVLWRVS